ncbi:hypothetical protein Tco_0586421 [Tanacetum coccineum]
MIHKGSDDIIDNSEGTMGCKIRLDVLKSIPDIDKTSIIGRGFKKRRLLSIEGDENSSEWNSKVSKDEVKRGSLGLWTDKAPGSRRFSRLVTIVRFWKVIENESVRCRFRKWVVLLDRIQAWNEGVVDRVGTYWVNEKCVGYQRERWPGVSSMYAIDRGDPGEDVESGKQVKSAFRRIG